MSTICPDKNRLESFSLGRLAEEDSDQLMIHLQDCSTCQLNLETIDSSEDTFIGKLRGAAPAIGDDPLQAEPEFRSATVKALAALANAETDEGEISLPQMIGEYEIDRPIGRGGMGRVFLGRHTKLSRQVAIKVLAQHRRWDQRMHERFEAEMRAIGGLNHPNIVAAYDARDVDGIAVLVTEYVEGLDGSDLLKRKGRLEIANACEIGSELCKALDYVAEKNLVHRDVKPSNVIVDDSGNVKLLDLGLARVQTVDGNDDFTATGQAMGTADYVAPEQINDARNVDVRTDLYGLGCTLYKMIAGRAPFAVEEYASPFAKMNAHVSQAPTKLSALRDDVPSELESLIHQMLEKDPAKRPDSAREVATRLEPFAKTADLVSMVSTARTLPAAQHRFEKVTDLKIESKAAAQPKGFLSRRLSLWATVAAGFAAVAAGMLLQIAITVEKPDGSKASLVIPDGSTAVIDAEGNITVKLSGGGSGVIPDDKVQDLRSRNEQGNQLPAPPRMPSESAVKISRGLADTARVGDEMDLVTRPILKSGNEKAPVVVHRAKISRLQNSPSVAVFQLTDSERSRLNETTLKRMHVECVPSNIEHVLKNDRYQLQGVWSGRLPNDVPFAVAFHNNRAILFAPGGFRKSAKFEVESIPSGGNARLLRVIGSDDNSAFTRELDKATYWFEESDTLEFSTLYVSSNSLRGVIAKMQRVAIASSEVELNALEFINQLKKEPVKFSVHLPLPTANASLPLSEIKYDQDPFITNRDFVSVRVSKEPLPTLFVSLTEIAGDKLHFVTATHQGARLVVVIDGKVVMAPTINAAISQELAVTGDFTLEKLKEIAKDLVPMSRMDRRVESENNLKLLMLGMFNYESVHQKFPASSNEVEGSEYPISWRVAILPYIGEKDLYKQFKLDQPWNSPHNKGVAKKMPDVFRLPGDDPDSIKTYYLAIAGEKTIIASDIPVGLGSITDGTSCTIALIQHGESVVWNQPKDIAMSDESVRQILSDPDPEFTFALGDSSVATIKRSKFDSVELSKIFTRDDGNFVDYELLASPKSPFVRQGYRDAEEPQRIDAPEPINKLTNEPGVVQEGLPLNNRAKR